VKANSAQSLSDVLSGDISLVPRAFLLSQTKTEQSPVDRYPLDLILYPLDRAIGFPNIYIIPWIVIYRADSAIQRLNNWSQMVLIFLTFHRQARNVREAWSAIHLRKDQELSSAAFNGLLLGIEDGA